MSTSQAVWQDWVAFLNKRGLGGLVASLLDAASPLALPGAQLIFIGEPVLSSFMAGAKIDAVTDLLEDNTAYQGFIAALKKGGEL
jgi:hypothetical protein